MKIFYNKSFKDITSIKCGGLIKEYIEIEDINELRLLNNYFIIGNGTNILASSKKYDNAVVRLKTKEFIKINDDILEVSSGYSLNKLINNLAALGLYNLTGLYMIPATIGGAIKMNAGAFNKEIFDDLIEIEVFDEKLKKLKKSDIEYGYRYSNIKGVITSAKFRIYKDIDKRNFVKNERLKKPYLNTLGSIFKNKNSIKAYQIIDMLNLRGYRINGALISNNHANYIVNDNCASAEDVYSLIELVRLNAYSKFKLKLDLEIILVNF